MVPAAEILFCSAHDPQMVGGLCCLLSPASCRRHTPRGSASTSNSAGSVQSVLEVAPSASFCGPLVIACTDGQSAILPPDLDFVAACVDRPEHVREGQIRAGQCRVGQAGQGRAGQVRTGQSRELPAVIFGTSAFGELQLESQSSVSARLETATLHWPPFPSLFQHTRRHVQDGPAR